MCPVSIHTQETANNAIALVPMNSQWLHTSVGTLTSEVYLRKFVVTAPPLQRTHIWGPCHLHSLLW